MCFSLISLSGAQDLQQVIRPSPEAAALGKYGEIPVSTYTGVPDITIPLYTIQDGELTVPISLSYHAGGNKVEEEASWVGLGFSLNSGGVITRAIRGYDDLKIVGGSYTGYYHNQLLPDPLGTGTPYQQTEGPLRTRRIIIGGIEHRDPEPYYLIKNGQSENYREWIDQLDLDWASDLYYLNANGLTGKFVFDDEKNPVLLKQQNISIEKPATGLDRWIIKDEKGIVYTFGSTQTTRVDAFEHVSAWYLTRMESPTGRSVDFEYYTTYERLIKSLPSYSEQYTTALGGNCGNVPSWSISTSDYQVNYLRKVKFNGGYIEFLRNSDFPESEVRKDIVGAEKLLAIRIYSTDSESTVPTLIKEYRFEYGYFESTQVGLTYENKFPGSFSEFDYDKKNKRLKLLGIREYGSDGSSKPPHVFEYNEEDKLPSKLSYSRDMWGYANNKSNTQLTPEHSGYYLLNGTGSLDFVHLNGADRSPSENGVQAAILKKITYPTGGSSEFTYHINEYSNFDGTEYETVHYGPFYFDQGKSSNTGPVPFTVNKESVVYFRFEILGNSEYDFDPQFNYYVNLTKEGVNQRTWTMVDVQADTRVSGNLYYVYAINLVPGTYQLSSNFPQGTSQEVTIRVITSWDETIETAPLKRKPGAGVRVEKIVNYLSPTESTGTRIFNYDTDNDYSSGVLMNQPRFVSVFPSFNCSSLFRFSSSNVPLSTSAGSVIGYKKVTELHGINGENGKTEYLYHSFEDQERPDLTRLPGIPTYSDSQNGNLLEKIDYVKRNGDYTKAQSLQNVYNVYKIDGRPWKVIWNMSVQKYPYYGADETYFPYVHWVAHYGTIADWDRLISTKVRQYDPSDETKFIEKTTEFSYNAQHLQLVESKEVVSTSDQIARKEILTKFKYPLDYTFTALPTGSQALGIKNLQDRHVVNAVIEKFQVKQDVNSSNVVSNQRITDGTVITFKPDKPYPDQIFKLQMNSPILLNEFGDGSAITANTFEMNGAYESMLTFLNYDEKGNIIAQRERSNVNKSYIWGYDKTLPIAEITNGKLETTTNITEVTHSAHKNISQDGTLLPFGESFESFINQSVISALDLYVVGGSSTPPSSPILTVMLFKSGSTVPVKTHNCTWGSNTVGTIELSAGTYQWYYTAQVTGGTSFTGYNLYITTDYTGQQTGYSEFHTSFEDNGVIDADPKTGRKVWSGVYPLVLPGVVGDYKLSYWTKTGPGPWTLIEQIVNAGVAQSMNIGSTGSVIDEVRLHPVGSIMSTYTYDPLIGMTSVTDANNSTTYYEYDAFGRLEIMRDPDENIVKHYKYNYKDEQ